MRVATLHSARTTLLLTACVGCASLSSRAQPITPSDEVESKVAEYAVQFTRGWRVRRLALDTSVAGPGRTATQVARLAQILHADTLVNGDSAMICPGDPSSCRLRGDLGVIVAVRVDSLTDSTAHATIDIRTLTGLPRVPIAFQSRRVRFIRRDGEWAFDRELWIEVSSSNATAFDRRVVISALRDERLSRAFCYRGGRGGRGGTHSNSISTQDLTGGAVTPFTAHHAFLERSKWRLMSRTAR